MLPPSAPRSPGQDIPVTWGVRNTGTISVPTEDSVWKEKVYVSPMTALTTNAIELGVFTNLTSLGVGESYSQMNALIRIPYWMSGTDYLFVVTDADDQVLEAADDNNVNPHATQLFVTLDPSLPDLVPSNAGLCTITWLTQDRFGMPITTNASGVCYTESILGSRAAAVCRCRSRVCSYVGM